MRRLREHQRPEQARGPGPAPDRALEGHHPWQGQPGLQVHSSPSAFLCLAFQLAVCWASALKPHGWYAGPACGGLGIVYCLAAQADLLQPEAHALGLFTGLSCSLSSGLTLDTDVAVTHPQAGPVPVRGRAGCSAPAGAAQAGRLGPGLPVRAQPQPPVPHVRGHAEARRTLPRPKARLRQVRAPSIPHRALTGSCHNLAAPS